MINEAGVEEKQGTEVVAEAQGEAGAVTAQAKVELTYSCDCCGGPFKSGRIRNGEKLCVNCIEIRRSLNGFVKRGMTASEVLSRAKQLLKQ